MAAQQSDPGDDQDGAEPPMDRELFAKEKVPEDSLKNKHRYTLITGFIINSTNVKLNKLKLCVFYQSITITTLTSDK